MFLLFFFFKQKTAYEIMPSLVGSEMCIRDSLYQVGSDAMLADMIVPEKRTNAYAIIRMINNAGIAIGPAVGGFVASRSYSYAFLGAAIGMITYSLLLIFRARETLNKAYLSNKVQPETLGGYGRVFRDRPYVVFALLI